MKPITLRMCRRCVDEFYGSVTINRFSAKEERCKCAFCGKDSLCDLYIISDRKGDKDER